MTGEHVIYDGRLVPKEGFRVFIYGHDGKQKLVESWAEYEKHIQTGIWFSTKVDAKNKQCHKGRK
jgi:hypothetical protein